MTISASLFFRALPPKGGVGGEERPDSPERAGQHRNGRSESGGPRPTQMIVMERLKGGAVAACRFGAIRERRPPRRRGLAKCAGRLRPAPQSLLYRGLGRRGRCSSLSDECHGTLMLKFSEAALSAPGIEAEGRDREAGSVHESPAAPAAAPVMTRAYAPLASGGGHRDTRPTRAKPVGRSW
jgi:hypothetical protein